MAGHIASPLSVEWCTQDSIIEANDKVFGGKPALDPAGNKYSRVGAQVEYCLPENDGLLDSWDFETIFNNPPFGSAWWRPSDGSRREYIYSLEGLSAKERKGWTNVSIADWVERAARAHAEHQSTVIQLLPSAMATKHWQDVIFKTADAICFPRGRLHYRLVETVPDHTIECAVEKHLGDAKKLKMTKKVFLEYAASLIGNCDCHAREGKTRLVETNGPAPMDSAVVYWGTDSKLFTEVYNDIGKVITP